MTGDHASRAAPLRTSDPRQLGPYTLVGRLGEGGMGTVFLARAADERLVAVKMIRTDLGPDLAFRRRFRSEVDRAREVPPFCTAEVLDADADHEPPYLVVEFVEGPSLAAVVEEQGPLTPANLHGVAIGVATALTAIHGAGVIHRDLKPNNVLLAPGSPKVIDFGIARAMDATSNHTGAGQMLGTVAYMAPERFGSVPGVELTPAADVFAWGAIVAFAGTGRTPFAAENAPLVAVRILTEPPNLTGLVPPLRDLVEWALAKDPAERPAARDLLERLLTANPSRSPALAAALADQPALRDAAEGAQAATDHEPVGGGISLAVADRDDSTQHLPETTIRLPAQRAPRTQDAPWGVVTSVPDDAPAADRPRSRWRRVGIVALLLAALVTALTVAGMVTALVLVTTRGTPEALGEAADPDRSPTGQTVINDPLTADGYWRAKVDKGHGVTCAFDDGLVVTRQKRGTYRCPGPMDSQSDFTLSVEVRFLTPGSCAGIWFRFTNASGGYALQVCPEGYYVVTHGYGDSSNVTTLRTFPFRSTVPLNAPVHVSISARGSTISLNRDGEPAGTLENSTFDWGRVALGIFQEKAENGPPYRVAFNNIDIRA